MGSFLLVSGMCSLIYETVWMRELRLVFGATTNASAAVLACFLGGLGIGGLLLGHGADDRSAPLRRYAFLESLIAVSAAVTPFLLWVVRTAYVAIGGTRVLGGAAGSAALLVLSALVFGVPTIAMGGTLPAAVRAVARNEDSGRQSVALLYGMNTLGGVAGCLFATFVLFEAMGTRASLWLACVLNLGVAGLAWRIAPSSEAHPADVALAANPEIPAFSRRVVLLASGWVGFVFCLMEIVWYRVLSPLLGGSVFTFGLILAVALGGIGLGGVAFGLWSRRQPVTGNAFAWTCLLQAVAVALPRAFGDAFAVVSALLIRLGTLGFPMQVAAWTLVTCVVVLPAAVIAGVQFPLLIGLLGRGTTGVGRDVGHAYAYNTAGAIAGSLAGGFGLIPALGADGCWRLVPATLVGLGVVALVLDVRRTRRIGKAVGPALLAVAAAASVAAKGPTAAWRHSPIGAGLVDTEAWRSRNDIRSWLLERRRAIEWDADGRESSIGIDSASGVSFVVNGKNDGNARGDAATTVMLGLLGAYIHPHPRRALVIGLGTGASVGWLAAVPTITDVDVGELEPAVLEVARRSAPMNHGALNNAKVHLVLGDARELLLTERAKYDLIASEPSNPYRAGVGALFTREFYEAAAAALNDDGFFLQWVQGYAVDADAIRTVYKTMGSVFPVVESWRLKSDDLLLMASRRPHNWDVPELRARLDQEPFRSAFSLAWRTREVEGVLAHYVAGPSTARSICEDARGIVNTDDRNRLEFAFARSLGKMTDFGIDDLRAVARAHGDAVPPLGAGVDWERADEYAIAILPDEGLETGRAERKTAGQARRISALNAFQQGDNGRVLADWAGQSQEPIGATEVAVFATALADSANPRAEPYIEKMRLVDATEAEVTLARLRFRQGRIDEGMGALERGYVGYRDDPWPLPWLMLRTLSFSVEVLERYPALADRMWMALREPFSMRLADEVRKKVAAFAAQILPPGPPCTEANEAFEPNPVWTEPFLFARAQCYMAARHALAERATNELLEFRQLGPSPFSDTRLLPNGL